jgi:hypothetical protein
MDDQAYIAGFRTKCAEHGVDPAVLLEKSGVGPLIAGAVAGARLAAPWVLRKLLGTSARGVLARAGAGTAGAGFLSQLRAGKKIQQAQEAAQGGSRMVTDYQPGLAWQRFQQGMSTPFEQSSMTPRNTYLE